MGIAAYNRGSYRIRRQAAAQQRPIEFDIIDRLNAIPKTADAVAPFGPMVFVQDHHGWWAQCPRTGFGYCYRSLHEAVKHWQVTITTYDHGTWRAERREMDA